MEFDIAEAEGVGAAAAADAAGDGEGLCAAENLGSVVEEDFIDDAGFEGGPVNFATGFDH